MKKAKKVVVICLAVLGGLTTIFISLVLLVAIFSPTPQPSHSVGVVAKQQKTDKPLKVSDININTLFNETNQYRSNKGAARLSLNPDLNDSARDKCLDLVKRDYWAHNAPNGTKPWVFIERYVDRYDRASENLAYGYTESKSVIEGWIASPSHRVNLIDRRLTDVGFGVCKSDNYVDQGPQLIVVQHFISR